LVPHPVEDIAGIDEQRRAVGLEPLVEHTRRMWEDVARSGEGLPGRQGGLASAV
jgi:hypothetical protein